LRRAGIRVDVGCLNHECQRPNRAFFLWVRAHRPWVTLKVASTLDGFIGSVECKPSAPSARFVTGEAARTHAHELRSQHDAVLVGVGTVLADNPRLTVRLPDARKPGPLRVVLDGHLRTPPSARLVRQLGTHPALIVGGQPRKGARDARARLGRERALRRAGAEVLLLPADRAGRVPIRSLLRALAERGVQSLLVEGGSRVHGAFISSALADSVAFFLAPRLAGAGRPITQGRGLDWRTPLRLGPLEVRAFGDDILLQADVIGPKLRRRL
jgi:diaminohydroxyphosphoribosylaminopyrimidine deaminase/5-amino-6-(5-phosphoribosylamino)uracil reductase